MRAQKLQAWPGSPWLLEPGKEALGVAVMAPHFPLGSPRVPTARTPAAPSRAEHAAG